MGKLLHLSVMMGVTIEVAVEMRELKIYSGVAPVGIGDELNVRPERR